MARHNELGKKGEDAAVAFLTELKHLILEKNYRTARIEIDIISNDKGTIVFTEVKTRSSNFFGRPEEAVGKARRNRMRQAAGNYLYEKKIDADVRFDIISITGEKGMLIIEHLKDAFFDEAQGENTGGYF